MAYRIRRVADKRRFVAELNDNYPRYWESLRASETLRSWASLRDWAGMFPDFQLYAHKCWNGERYDADFLCLFSDIVAPTIKYLSIIAGSVVTENDLHSHLQCTLHPESFRLLSKFVTTGKFNLEHLHIYNQEKADIGTRARKPDKRFRQIFLDGRTLSPLAKLPTISTIDLDLSEMRYGKNPMLKF
jgi:hypothetical protein